MDIFQAAINALVILDKPCTAEQICEVIINQKFYKFFTSQPVHFLDSQLKKACENTKGSARVKEKYFYKYNNLYGLLKWKQIHTNSQTYKDKESNKTMNAIINDEVVQDVLNPQEIRKERDIYEAAMEALTLLDKPSTAMMICSSIIRNNLYKFNIIHPDSYLDLVLSRACENTKGSADNQKKYFYKSNNLYGLLKWKEKENEELSVNANEHDGFKVVSISSLQNIVPNKTYYVRFPNESSYYFVVYRDKKITVLLDYASERVIHTLTSDFNNNMFCDKTKIIRFEVYQNNRSQGYSCLIYESNVYEKIDGNKVEYFSQDEEYILKSNTSVEYEYNIIFRDSNFTICMSKNHIVKVVLTRVFDKTYTYPRYRICKRIKDSSKLKNDLSNDYNGITVNQKEAIDENINSEDNLIEVKYSVIPQILPDKRYYIDLLNGNNEYFIIYRDEIITVLVERLDYDIISVQTLLFNNNIMHLKKKKVSFNAFKDIRNRTFSLEKINYSDFSYIKAKDIPNIKWSEEYLVKSITAPNSIYTVIFRNTKYTILMDKELDLYKIGTNEFNKGAGGSLGKIKDYKTYKRTEDIIKLETIKVNEIKQIEENLKEERKIDQYNTRELEQVSPIDSKKKVTIETGNNLIEIDGEEIEDFEPKNGYIVYCNNIKCKLIYKKENILVLLNNENKTLVLTLQEFQDKMFIRNNVQVKISIFKEKIGKTEEESNNADSISLLAQDLFNNLDNLLG